MQLIGERQEPLTVGSWWVYDFREPDWHKDYCFEWDGKDFILVNLWHERPRYTDKAEYIPKPIVNGLVCVHKTIGDYTGLRRNWVRGWTKIA